MFSFKFILVDASHDALFAIDIVEYCTGSLVDYPRKKLALRGQLT